jgi:hypothetical protein
LVFGERNTFKLIALKFKARATSQELLTGSLSKGAKPVTKTVGTLISCLPVV